MNENDKIILNIDGPSVTAGAFMKGVTSFFKMISEVADEITKKRHSLTIRVSVKSGSNLVLAEPLSKTKRNPVDLSLLRSSIKEGISSLEQVTSSRPSFFTDEALEYARDLASLKSSGITTIEVRVSGKSLAISSKAVASVDDILGSKHEAMGSIEGRVEILDGRNGVRCAIRNESTNQQVMCFASPDSPELEDLLITSFRKRASVYGLIKYRKDGTAISIQVDRLEIFPNPTDLPSLDQLQGFMREA